VGAGWPKLPGVNEKVSKTDKKLNKTERFTGFLSRF
jgi:hypothetical protein